MKNKPRIISPKIDGGDMVWVCDIIDSIFRTWREEVIDNVFLWRWSCYYKEYPFVAPFKRMFWPSTQMGSTWSSLNTGFYRKQTPSNNRVHQLQIPWNLCGKKIWSLLVPNKVKNLVRRACTDSLPTKANLIRRKIIIDSLCDICRLH